MVAVGAQQRYREQGAGGVRLFYEESFTDEFYQAIKSGPFRSVARLPQPKRRA